MDQWFSYYNMEWALENDKPKEQMIPEALCVYYQNI